MASQPAKMNNSENHIACIKISTKMIEIKNIIIIIINLKKIIFLVNVTKETYTSPTNEVCHLSTY